MTPTLVTPAADRRRRWNTPRILQAGRLALLVAEALLLVAVLEGTALHRGAMQTVGHDTAPSIIAAQGIRTAISGMDAEMTHELLAAPGSESAALTSFHADRDQAVTALVAAAENITYGDKERGPIRRLQNGLAVYEELAQQTRDLHQSHSPGTLETYHQAETLVHSDLLPAANDLDAANYAVLDRTYHREAMEGALTRDLVIVLGLLTMAGLIVMQVYLSRRMRRTLNPMLLAATLLSLWITLHSASAMGREQGQLRVAKEDAFDSVSALWRARAVAYEAEGDESRSLVDPARAQAARSAFTAEVNALAKVPGGLTPDQLVAAARNDPEVEGFSGYLADELHNLTFPGERDAALNTLSTFEDYVKLDTTVQNLQASGQTQRAADLCLGTSPGGAAGAFQRFDDALGATLAINQGAFEAAVANGLADLHGLEAEAFVTFAIVAVLIFWGLSARIKEYQ